ncbi:H(+)/hexose cotransporter 3 [Acorus calamus]|uniref:H(+)/hexose cotransporter 3 n=1 Tax=Acorus calamus TaxID=4465 RepID=A0AAV9DXL9_ACOCL|nr:H(+)/hexose cotransporter 3 [Acorus calamus]
MAPAKLQGMLNISFQLMITLEIFATNLINNDTSEIKSGKGWRISLDLAGVPVFTTNRMSILGNNWPDY